MLNYYKKMQLFIILIVLIFPNVSSLNKAYAEGDNNLNIRVSNIPSNIGNLKLLVEGSNGISYLLREETKGQGTLNVGVKLPVGNTYRIRVIGYNAGETFPQVIVGGEVKSLSVTEGQTNNAAISLERAKV
ncbi:hypothetical protein ACIQXV_17150, partial [Neobacillus sp. NPDC097160]|uniref:hypothetical protein n=1 Tax=Neobacillus sp. NPDC097160 TaxID=3364298 RepID=UPI0037FD594C